VDLQCSPYRCPPGFIWIKKLASDTFSYRADNYNKYQLIRAICKNQDGNKMQKIWKKGDDF
jgi:hypothetical protein